MCFGDCSVYSAEIREDKTMLLYVDKEYLEDDLSRQGQYEGRVADTLFTKLENSLAAAGIDTLNFNEGYADYPYIKIIVYYNGKRKSLGGKGYPNAADSLISSLYQICRTTNARQIFNSYWFEGESDPELIRRH